MRRVLRWTLLWMAVSLLGVHAQAEGKAFQRQTMDYFSTVCMLTIYPEDNADGQKIWREVKATLARIEQAVSVSDASSDVARFNALQFGEETAVGSDTAAMLKIAMQVHEQTDGLYDPTVYPLIDLWGFSPRFNGQVYALSLPYDRAYVNGLLPLPEGKYIEAFRQLAQLRGVTLIERGGQFFLRKDIPPVTVDGVTYQAMLDLGGIAKGYACDCVRALLKEHGIERGVFICGESSITFLQSTAEDGCYRIELGKPRPGLGREACYASLRASGVSLSSSSDSRHAYVISGVRYCHLIDPRTGWPINRPNEDGVQQGVIAATIFGESAAYDDAMTTALCVMGKDGARAFMAAHPEVQTVIVCQEEDGQKLNVYTNLPEGTLSMADDAYHLEALPQQ